LHALRPTEPSLATAEASFEVRAAAASITGTLSLAPSELLLGDSFDAAATVTNRGTSAVTGLPLAVELTVGEAAPVVRSAGTSVDLAPGETKTLTVRLAADGVPAGRWPVVLRRKDDGTTLDIGRLRVHGPLLPPSIDSPADGARVRTAHPTLAVNN